jgi:hypothetical protein
MDVFAFEVSAGGHSRVVNTTSAGKARYSYLLDVRDCWPGITFSDIKVKKIGAPVTSADFLRTARYRGMPDLRCGDQVKVNGRRGVIVGHNHSANFDVLFNDDSDWSGAVLNCHPSDIRLLVRDEIAAIREGE